MQHIICLLGDISKVRELNFSLFPVETFTQSEEFKRIPAKIRLGTALVVIY